ncbi:diguanylate cyclase domain-containing protein [Acetobacterium sp.]|uniref:diguanylate cyclase domain-containing protein n=1 Tax=Acetobacterium sp. TaxID=1872094 RepID=UPI002F419077
MMKNFYDSNSQSEILERIFDLNLDLLCIIDINGQFFKVNIAWENVLGYSPDELIKKDLIDFVHPHDLDATSFALKELIPHNDNLTFSNRFRSKNGDYRYIEWNFHRYGDFIYVAAKDITQKKRNETARKEARTLLGSKNQQSDIGSDSPVRQKVLIVDDSLLNTKLLEQALMENFDILIANSGKEALAIANSNDPPDIILLDIMMPEMDGYEVCEYLQLDPHTKDIPVIFVTALSEAESEEHGLKIGAIDYITKPFSIPIVKAKIKNHLALKYYQDILKINTDVDQLTNIANRRRFDEMFSIEIKKAKRMGSFLSVLMLDIDHFKFYNDTYGHLEGDECLRKVAFAIKNTLKRPGDFAARWGGEEFTCLLPDTDRLGAAKVCEKLRISIMDLGIAHKSSPVYKDITVSIGVITSDPSEDGCYESLLKHADAALYQAKDSGRNRVNIWNQ